MSRHHHINDLEFDEGMGPSAGCCTKKCLRQNLLVIFIIIAVFAGVALGFGLREVALTKREIKYVAFIGDIFLRMLKMLILPLIVSSLVSGLASLDTAVSGKIGLRAVIYYFLTTIFAVALGIILVMSIKPGNVSSTINTDGHGDSSRPITTADTFLDLIRNMFPDNLIAACFQQYRTELKEPKVPKPLQNASTSFSFLTSTVASNVSIESSTSEHTNNLPNATPTSMPTSKPNTDYYSWDMGSKMVDGINVLGLVIFSVTLGITLGRLGNKGKPLADVFNCLNDVVMYLVDIVMKLSPVGILFLIAAKVADMKNVGETLQGLGLYTITVLVGLFIHGFVVLPLIYFVFTRKNPVIFLVGVIKALVTAIGTSSSSATLPVTIKCLEENNKIDTRITRFVLPIGATINMDGTALYEAVAALFIAQYRNVYLDVGKILAVSITATAASIGAAGVPQAGLITMVMVLDAVGLPSDDVAIIMAIDWFLDRIRTMINVWGDCIGAGVVDHLSQGFLSKPSLDNLTEIGIDPPFNQNGTAYMVSPKTPLHGSQHSSLKGSTNVAYISEKEEQVTGF